MRSVLAFVLVVSTTPLSDCLASSQQLKVSGATSDYFVPLPYIRKAEFPLLSRTLEEDPASALLVEVPIRESGISNEGVADQNVVMLLFYDKVYGYESVLAAAAERIVAGSVEVSHSEGMWRYRRTSEPSTDYYFSFDPRKCNPNRSDFLVERKEATGLSIEGVHTHGETTCQMRSVYDGILVQTTAVGDLCESGSFSVLQQIQNRTLSSWRG